MTAPLIRLHIAPFTTDLVPSILSSEARKTASNISFHSLQTFPENNYGYVDLPQMEAEKIKKKLNGAILKGKKIKIEEARPKKRKHRTEEVENEEISEHNLDRPKKSSTTSKQEKNVISGHELSPDRKVKRGWTESKSDKSQKKKDKTQRAEKSQASSKYTDKEELLFRTKVPKNKKDIVDKDTKRKEKKQNSDSEVVHEFKKSTTIPSFLRSEGSSGQKAISYEDGKGWLDEESNVIAKEDGKVSKRRQAAHKGMEDEIVKAQPAMATRRKRTVADLSEPPADVIADSRSSDGSKDEEDTEEEDKADQPDLAPNSSENSEDDETSSSGSSILEGELEGVLSDTSDAPQKQPMKQANTPPPKIAVHPLEALFKKPNKPASLQAASSAQDIVKPSLEVQTSFSFFEHNDDNDNLPPMPMTPFSSQDLRNRESRSAAPTPDTAHPSRMSSIFNGEESEGELSEMEDGNAEAWAQSMGQSRSNGEPNLQVPQTDFEKQFWEKRGENNRAWKARRRAVLKEKRQRENRARRPKNW